MSSFASVRIISWLILVAAVLLPFNPNIWPYLLIALCSVLVAMIVYRKLILAVLPYGLVITSLFIFPLVTQQHWSPGVKFALVAGIFVLLAGGSAAWCVLHSDAPKNQERTT